MQKSSPVSRSCLILLSKVIFVLGGAGNIKEKDRPRLLQLVDLLTGTPPPRSPARTLCVADEKLTLQTAASLAEFGAKHFVIEERPANGSWAPGGERSLPAPGSMRWVGGGRRRRSCSANGLSMHARAVLKPQLFSLVTERVHRVLLDHLERVFDLGLVYHDFYSGTLKEHGGPLSQRPVLVKRLSEFAFGREGDPEGYMYPKVEETTTTEMKPTTVLELMGQFYYHAHNETQCRWSPCGQLGPGAVPVRHFERIAPLHFRKAFCNYYHFTTVALGRLVTLLPRLRADPSIVILVPHQNMKGQSAPFIAESVRALGIEASRVLPFPPCQLVLAEEVLLAGSGPRVVFGRGTEKRDRAVMIDIADREPARAARRAVLAALQPHPVAAGDPGRLQRILLIDRPERRRFANLDEVVEALQEHPLDLTGPIYCEKMTFIEQVTTFHNARVVAAVHGACLSNSLYMPAGALLVDAVPVKNFMGSGLLMPLECGVTWFWTLTSNVGVRYVSLMLPNGDFDADSVHVPARTLRTLILENLPPEQKSAGNSVFVDNATASADVASSRGVPAFLSDGTLVMPGNARALDEDFVSDIGELPIYLGDGTRLTSRGTASAVTESTSSDSLVTDMSSGMTEGNAVKAPIEVPRRAPSAVKLTPASPSAAKFAPSPKATKVLPAAVKVLQNRQSGIQALDLHTLDCPATRSEGHALNNKLTEASALLCGLTADAAAGLAPAVSRCIAMMQENSTQEAFACFQQKFLSRRSTERARKTGGDFGTTLRKMWHDYEMLDHLETKGVLKAEFSGAAEFYLNLYNRARVSKEAYPDRAFEVRIPQGSRQRDLWAQLHNTALHFPRDLANTTPFPVLKVDQTVLDTAMLSLAKDGNAVLDGVLSDSALQHIRSFLEDASIYFRVREGYLRAVLEDGLATPLLAAITLAFQAFWKAVLGPLQVCEVQAWKSDNSHLLSAAAAAKQRGMPGVQPARAAIAILLWLVPPRTGQRAPVALSLPRVNQDALPVHYMVNRAVVWRDNCPGSAPIWHNMRFPGGFLQRGIHLIFRFQQP